MKNARNATDIRETPVAVSSNDRGDQLGQAEGEEEGDRGPLHEEERVGTGDEDKSLRNLSNSVHVQER